MTEKTKPTIHITHCTDIDTAVLYLNQHFGSDWYEKIDLDQLNMLNHNTCVIGQLSGDISCFCYKVHAHSAAWLRTMFDYNINGKDTQPTWEAKIKELRNISSKIPEKNQKFLLTLSDGSSMIVSKLSEAPINERFTYKEI